MPPRRLTKWANTSLAASESLTVTVKPVGTTPEKIQSLAQSIPKHQAVQKELSCTRYRLLRIDLLDRPEETKSASPKPPDGSRPPSSTTPTTEPYSPLATCRRPEA